MQQKIYRAMSLLSQSEAVRQSAVVSVSTVATGVISGLALIYVSRAIGPTQFGIFSVGIAIMSVLSKFGDAGLNTVITRLLPKLQTDQKTATLLLKQVISWKLLFTGMGVVGALVLSQPLLRALNYPHFDQFLLALFGCVVLIVYEHTYVVLSALHRFTAISLLGLLQASLKLIVFVSIGILGLASVQTIALAYYSLPLVALAVFAIIFRDWIVLLPGVAPKSIQKDIARHAFHAGFGVVAMVLIANVDMLFVQKYLNPFETGIYAGASRIALFVGFVASAVGGVLNNRVARYHDRETLVLYLKKSASLVVVAALGFLCFLPVTRLILILTIGREYLPGLIPLIILVFNSFLTLAIMPLISFFYAVNHPKYFSWGGLLQVAIIVLGNVLFLSSYGLPAAAVVRVVASTAHGLFSIGYIMFALKQLNQQKLMK